MRPANERRRYIITYLIGWAHTQNDPRIGNVYYTISGEKTLGDDRHGVDATIPESQV